MSDRQKFTRYGNDEEGHYFAPVEAESSGGGSLMGLFLICAALFVLVYILRNSYSPAATATAVTYAAPSVWPNVLRWIGGGLVGILGMAFIVVQCIVAAQDRREYWVLRLGRASFTHTYKVVRGIGFVFALIWRGVKPVAINAATKVYLLLAGLIRALHAVKGLHCSTDAQQLCGLGGQGTTHSPIVHNYAQSVSEKENSTFSDNSKAELALNLQLFKGEVIGIEIEESAVTPRDKVSSN